MNHANIEAIKEAARTGFLFILSWIITTILSQITNVPEVYDLKVWVFTFSIPIRIALTTGLTLAGRYLDKLIFERNKTVLRLPKEEIKGLLPW